MATFSNIEQLALAVDISDKIIDNSILLDDNTKQAFKFLSKNIKAILKKESKMNSYGINSLKNEFLAYWNESINPDTEKFWAELKKLKEIQQRFTKTEIEEIDDIISKDEKQRIEILKKCLRKNEIPKTQYLKFGECMAYANNCRLWKKYFNQSEVDELYDIWKNFKAE